MMQRKNPQHKQLPKLSMHRWVSACSYVYGNLTGTPPTEKSTIDCGNGVQQIEFSNDVCVAVIIKPWCCIYIYTFVFVPFQSKSNEEGKTESTPTTSRGVGKAAPRKVGV